MHLRMLDGVDQSKLPTEAGGDVDRASDEGRAFGDRSTAHMMLFRLRCAGRCGSSVWAAVHTAQCASCNTFAATEPSRRLRNFP
jgi:hypothetical protein